VGHGSRRGRLLHASTTKTSRA